MLKIKDIMTSDVFVLEEGENLALARSLMKHEHIRHVPIVDRENRFVGLVTHRDVLAHTISILADIDEKEQFDLDLSIPLDKIMNREVVTASSEMELPKAIGILLENKFGCLPVVDGETLVGIVTEADFLKLTYRLLANRD